MIRRLAAQAFEALFAVLAVLAGVTFFARPEALQASALRDVVVHPWDYIWSASYALSGLLTIVGLLRGKASWEGAGVTWLGGAIACNVIALVAVRGWVVLPLLVTHFAALGACVARAAVLYQGLDTVMLRRVDP